MTAVNETHEADTVRDSPGGSLGYVGVAIASALVFFAGYGFAVSNQTRSVDGVSAAVPDSARIGVSPASSAQVRAGVGDDMVAPKNPHGASGVAMPVQRVMIEAVGPSAAVPLVSVESGIVTQVIVVSESAPAPSWVGLDPHGSRQPVVDGSVLLPALAPGTYTLFGDEGAPLAHVLAR